MLKKTSASAGLVIVTAAGTLLASSPAYALDSLVRGSYVHSHHRSHHRNRNWNANEEDSINRIRLPFNSTNNVTPTVNVSPVVTPAVAPAVVPTV